MITRESIVKAGFELPNHHFAVTGTWCWVGLFLMFKDTMVGSSRYLHRHIIEWYLEKQFPVTYEALADLAELSIYDSSLYLTWYYNQCCGTYYNLIESEK